jgi:Asp-tRNA(Asn)/Glu-tRNA(Gln) amidotransferase C subunit
VQLDPETFKRLQEASAIAIDPETVKRLQETSAIAIDPETMKRLQETSGIAIDPETMKRLQEASAIAIDPETMKRLQEASAIAIDPETVKRLQETSAIAIDPETMKRLQETSGIAIDPRILESAQTSLGVSVRQLRSLGARVALQLEQPRATPVASFVEALRDDDQHDTDLASEWLIGLHTARQRRLLLLSLTAISSVLDAVDAEAKVQLPGHLILITYALIAVAVLLNEAIDQAGQ